MTEPHHAVLARLTEDFSALSRQTAKIAGELTELERLLAPPPAAPATHAAIAMPAAPAPVPVPVAPRPAAAPPYPPYPMPGYYPPPAGYGPPVAPPPGPPSPPLMERLTRDREQGWIPKLLAVAGVAVTLIGVVLLLVLAAQAGILRPEMRVGAGAVLAGVLVGAGLRLQSRPGGRVGAIALAATGIAAAYFDVIAVTTIYHWVGSVPGLVIASLVGGGGLILARRWDSQHLALLVMVPLIVLAPVITDGITLLLVGFMLALSAAALPVQIGKNWVGMHAARIVAVTGPLLIALVAAQFGTRDDPWLIGGACGVGALLAVLSALVLLPSSTNGVAIALLTVAGVFPALASAGSVNRGLAALMATTVAVVMLAIVLAGRRLPGVPGIVGHIWAALSAVSAVIAVTVAFDGHIAGPVLLAMAVVVTVAGRRSVVARWAAIGFGVAGAALFLGYAPPATLLGPTTLSISVAVATLAASLLGIAAALTIAWSWTNAARGPALRDDALRMVWACAGLVVVYAITAFTVTTGVLIAGGGGFLAGHMAATICWIALAAALLVYALRLRDKDSRTAPIAGGLALTAGAMVKLFLFDLGTLDGIFRVIVFIVVGLILLGMGTGYARSLAQQDRSQDALSNSEAGLA